MINIFNRLILRFTKGVQIGDACYIAPRGRDEFIVEYKGKKIILYAEMGVNPDRVIYKSKNKYWLPPFENDNISANDYDYIVNALVRFLKKYGKSVSVIED